MGVSPQCRLRIAPERTFSASTDSPPPRPAYIRLVGSTSPEALVIVGIGFLYAVWVFLAGLTVFIMKKAMAEPPDDEH